MHVYSIPGLWLSPRLVLNCYSDIPIESGAWVSTGNWCIALFCFALACIHVSCPFSNDSTALTWIVPFPLWSAVMLAIKKKSLFKSRKICFHRKSVIFFSYIFVFCENALLNFICLNDRIILTVIKHTINQNDSAIITFSILSLASLRPNHWVDALTKVFFF